MDRRDFTRAMLALGVTAALPVGFTGCATNGLPRRVTGVDTHAHVFHRGLPFVPGRRYTPDYDAYPEQFIAMLDANGMSQGVIIPISILGTNNDYTVECIAKSNGRLRGLAVVDPATDVSKLETLDRAGIVGIRLNLIRKEVPDVKTGAWRELIGECRRLGWQVEVYDDAERLPKLLGALVDSGVDVVVDHFGKPSTTLGVDDPGFKYLLSLGATRRVWVKLSAPYRSSNTIAAAAAPLLRRSFGPERLMWGSDWPHTGFEGKVQYAELRSQLDTWVPDVAERHTILAETPFKLYRF